MNKKALKSIFMVLIFLFSIATTVVGSSDLEPNINENIAPAPGLLNQIEMDEDVDFNDLENQSYEFFKKLVGNESNIGRCGKAFINSTGRGLTMARVRPMLFINIPIKIYFPYWIMFPRRAVIWLICSIYGSDEDAQTIIEPVDSDEKIVLDGPHIVFGGIFVFPTARLLKSQLQLKTIPRLNNTKPWMFPLLKKLIELIYPPLEKLINVYHGDLFWYIWRAPETNNTIFDSILGGAEFFVNKVVLQMIRSLFWQYRRIKIPLLGLLDDIDWSGYFPFYMWSEL
jgi:hypothetical protein